MSVLALTVYVTDHNGDVHQCLAGTSPRAELAELIRNPVAWQSRATGPADDEAGPSVDSSPTNAPPPRGGPGGSRMAWEGYARSQGVELEEGLTRDGVIEACRQAGKPV